MVENNDLFESLKKLSSVHVLCVGDVMMDRFVYGAIDRISPEAPIPVLRVENEKYMLGGAGNVVANMAALGVKATLLSVVGDDTVGADIQKQLAKQNIIPALIIADDRFTTVKTRFVCDTQQMLRVDREKTEDISSTVEEKIIAAFTSVISDMDVVVLSDYKKGLLTDTLIKTLISVAHSHGKPVIVDPKGHDFARYRGASVLTPNRKELETATGMTAATDDDVRAAAMKVIVDCGVETVLATRSKDGMSIIASGAEPVHIPSQVREVYDVSGAGDTVIAVFAAGIAASLTLKEAAQLANVAAGIVVGKSGTATTSIKEIEQTLIATAAVNEALIVSKVVDKKEASDMAANLRLQGQKIGFTNGCFDLLHPGHLSSLRQTKENCDFLVVALNSDASVKRLKGPTRPIQNETARADVLAALEMVDMVIIFEEDTPIELIKSIKPDVLAKGGQYALEEVVGYDVVTSYGGEILRLDMEDGFSTTNTVSRMSK